MVCFKGNGGKIKAVGNNKFHEHHLKLHDVFKVSQEDWHQIFNLWREPELLKFNTAMRLLKDIERLEFYKGNNE